LGKRLTADERKLSDERAREKRKIYWKQRREAYTEEDRARVKQWVKDGYAKCKAKAQIGLCTGGLKCKNPAVSATNLCMHHWMRVILNGQMGRSRREGQDVKLRLNSRKATIDAFVALWNKQKGRCAITGLELFPGINAALDHIVPVARGGTNGVSNMRFVHKLVNFMKYDLTDEDFTFLLLDICPPLLKWARRRVNAHLSTGVGRPGQPAREPVHDCDEPILPAL